MDSEDEFHEFSKGLDVNILVDDNEGSKENVIRSSIKGVSNYNALPNIVWKGLCRLDQEGLEL